MFFKLLFIFVILISFAFFNNIFLKNVGKTLFKTLEKTLLGLGLSIILFLIVNFLLEGPLSLSKAIINIIDGLFIGWIVSLFNHISNAE